MDLRELADVAGVVERVSRALDVRDVPGDVVCKRRSLGFATDRAIWVRIEHRPVARVDGQGWGTEAAAALSGIAMPTWRSSTSWRADDGRCGMPTNAIS